MDRYVGITTTERRMTMTEIECMALSLIAYCFGLLTAYVLMKGE